MRLFLFGFSTWLLMLGHAHAQVDSLVVQDTVSKEASRQKIKVEIPKVSGVRVGTDLTNIAFNIIDPDKQQYQLNTELMFGNQYFVVVDLGRTSINRNGESGQFSVSSDGSFISTGLDYNLMHKSSSFDAGHLGFRMGRSQFDHQLEYVTGDTTWGEKPGIIKLDSQTAYWFSLVTGLKVQVAGNFYLGANVRMKVLLSRPKPWNSNINDIPGFGTLKSTSRLAYNLQLSYRIPFG